MARVTRWVKCCHRSLIMYCMMLCLIYLIQGGYFSRHGPHLALPSRDYRIHTKGLTQEKDNGVFQGNKTEHRKVGILSQHGLKSAVKTGFYILHAPKRQKYKTKKMVVELQEPCFKQVQIWTDNSNHIQGKTDFACPGLPCGLRQIEDTSYETMATSDAVLFHYLSTWDWEEMLQHKRPGQKWIFSSSESPVNTQRNIIPLGKFSNKTYDYIMSYRRHEGNLFGDFGRVTEIQEVFENSDNWAEGKDKLAMWSEQECNNFYVKWERLKFVQELARLIPVDIYGPCGRTDECRAGTPYCKKKMQRHKFYLALEDCSCRNFITKVWDNAFQNNLVPVVYGPPQEDYDLVLPPGSFIHIEQFSTLKELANYLVYLDTHDDLYNTFFDWKKRWKVESIPESRLLSPPMMCQVVDRLLSDKSSVRYGKYRPLVDWVMR